MFSLLVFYFIFIIYNEIKLKSKEIIDSGKTLNVLMQYIAINITFFASYGDIFQILKWLHMAHKF